MFDVFKDRNTSTEEELEVFKENRSQEEELGMGHTFTCCCCPTNDDLPEINFTFQLKCCVNNINSDQVDGEEDDNQQQQPANVL